MTDRLNPEAQAALDAVRQGRSYRRARQKLPLCTLEEAFAAALENLDARLKALEGGKR